MLSLYSVNLKRSFYFIVINYILLLSGIANGQVTNQYNLNIYNGLPTNHIYCLLIDKHGYLWMGTEKGVVRYNGYKLKIYNYSDGLFNEDVWRLKEDKKDRIWAFSISDHIGYIKNSIYTNVVNTSHKTLYPRDAGANDSSIMFFSAYVNEMTTSLCLERHDSVFGYSLAKNIYGAPILDNDRILVFTDTDIRSFNYKSADLNNISAADQKEICKINTNEIDINPWKTNQALDLLYKNYLINWERNSNVINLIDIKNCVKKTIDIKSYGNKAETIRLMFQVKDDLFVAGDSNVYFIDSGLRLRNSFPISSVIDSRKEINGSKISYCIADTGWGICVSTTSDGVFITNKKTADYFKNKAGFDLPGYKSLGNISDSIFYWWNNATSTLAKTIWNKRITYTKLNEVRDPDKIIAYNADTSLLLSRNKIFWMDIKSGKLTNYFSNLFYNNKDSGIAANSEFGALDIIIERSGDFYTLSKIMGFLKIIKHGNKLSQHYIDNDRYNGMTYDSAGNYFLVYNNSNVLIYNKVSERFNKITSDILGKLGIKTIETILIDNRYGNIFVKEYDKLWVFNKSKRSAHTLFNNFRLKGTLIKLHNNYLVLAGKFGVAFSKITGPSSVSGPVVFENIKNAAYTDIYDMQVSAKKEVYLNTDKGVYTINFPSDSEIDHKDANVPLKYKLILSYNNKLIDIKPSDTINIDQENMHLQFDVINPTGNGTLKYAYRLNYEGAEWQELHADELNLPKLKTDQYYTLSLWVYDDVWRSNRTDIILYITPYWWQKPTGIRLLWAAGILGSILLIALIITITKKIVTRKTGKRNFQLEIELKSVYSQVNPHFISNSLGVVMYLIKTGKLDDAYHHLSNFSHLLRSYIKSSRNRYTSLDEEIANLETYIGMQQLRFNNKFEYRIITDNTLSGSTKIPSLLLQPLVENAIIHGLLEKETKGHLLIEIKKVEDDLVCIIDDDGIGRERSKRLSEESTTKRESYGDDLVKDLIRIFNKFEKVDIHVSYIDKVQPETGTIVVLKIKKYRNDDPLFLSDN